MRQYVGEKRGRIEGLDKATGRAKYAGDFQMENMLKMNITISAKTLRYYQRQMLFHLFAITNTKNKA